MTQFEQPKIDTAVIPVAGAGSRLLPITSYLEKCMMPLEGRPVVDYTVQDCIAAGVERIIFVTSERGQQQLNDYYGQLPADLKMQLERSGKQAQVIDEEARRHTGITIEYVVQPADGEYGTAVPLWLVRDRLVTSDRFAVMMGDDFVFRPDGSSELLSALSDTKVRGSEHIVMGSPVSPADAKNYGIHAFDDDGKYIGIVEKPDPSKVSIPENPTMNISKYVFSQSILGPLAEVMSRPLSPGAERQITDVVDLAIVQGQQFGVHQVEGHYLDGGTPNGLAAAALFIRQSNL